MATQDIVTVLESRKDLGQFMESVSLVRPPESERKRRHLTWLALDTVFTPYDSNLEVLPRVKNGEE